MGGGNGEEPEAEQVAHRGGGAGEGELKSGVGEDEGGEVMLRMRGIEPRSIM